MRLDLYVSENNDQNLHDPENDTWLNDAQPEPNVQLKRYTIKVLGGYDDTEIRFRESEAEHFDPKGCQLCWMDDDGEIHLGEYTDEE